MRPIKCRATPVPARSLLVRMVANLSEGTFLPMLPRPESSFARAEGTSVWPKFKTHQVCLSLVFRNDPRPDSFVSDCPEREATYIITNGGISDPDKA